MKDVIALDGLDSLVIDVPLVVLKGYIFARKYL